MRIHASFDDQHRSRRRGATAGQPYRRLLRLVLAMVLVILVMRQAANPRIYEVFFAAPPTAPDALTAGGNPSGSLPAANGDVGEAAAAPTPQHQAASDQTIAALDAATNGRLMQVLAEARAAGRLPDRADLPQDLLTTLEAAAREAGRSGPEPVHWAALQESLDRWALQRVDPAAVWKAVDALAFYRLLEDPAPTWLSRQNGVQASVTALLQQPDAYRHRRIVVPATVARAIQRPAAENPFGVNDYWELWLRPRDGSDHPLVLFTREVTPEIAQVPADAALLDGPAVWTDGVYLKRLAHRSAAGGELSPALVGKIHPLAAEVAAAPVEPAPPAPGGWWLVGLAALIGCSAALLIAVQNRRQANRLRALRRAALDAHPQLLPPFEDDRSDRNGAAS